MAYRPVAVQFTDEKPEGALQFAEGARGCVVQMLYAVATKGRTAVFDRRTVGCPGGFVGLCFGSVYDRMPGGIEYFLSTGRGEGSPPGERYFKSPEVARAWVDQIPITDVPHEFVVFRPISEANDTDKKPDIVVFAVNPDQLAALVCLAGYDRPPGEHVAMPFGAGCHSICLLPYREAAKEFPRAIVGAVDPTVRTMAGPDVLTFSVPYAMFRELEGNVPGSFLETHTWAKVKERLAAQALPAGSEG